MTDALCHLVVDGNSVLEFKLVRSVEDIESDEAKFRPEMCHQVFGENENIFGYTDLSIQLYYSAGSLQTYLGINYSDKIEPDNNDGMKADDVEGALKKVLAPGYVTNLDHFISLLENDVSFVPHGQLLHAFTAQSHTDNSPERQFEVYYSETSTPGFLSYHERLQTFLLWYVDAASFIDVDDDQWTFFTVFEKYRTSEGNVRYASAAYATVYRYYAYPKHTRPRILQVLTLPPLRTLGIIDWFNAFEKYRTSEGNVRYASAAYATVYRYYAYPKHTRPRISQVLTLPPFRKLGICAQLLQAIYSHFTILPEVVDITVEDPSQDFQRIRDYVDAKNCESLPAFQPERLVEGFTPEMTKQAAAKHKINRKQARRVYEILRLKNTNTSDKNAYLQYRLDVKNRLNAPFQKKKLEMKKLQKVLKPEEYAATVSTSGAGETHGRLAGQYAPLEEDYQRVIYRLELA